MVGSVADVWTMPDANQGLRGLLRFKLKARSASAECRDEDQSSRLNRYPDPWDRL